jgi:hypothetical protein
VVSKNCDPANPAHTATLAYTFGRADGAALDIFLSFDIPTLTIKVAFQSVIGSYDLYLRGTLPNDQTVHETFTVNITEKPAIIIDS